jgi:hypothetical protein
LADGRRVQFLGRAVETHIRQVITQYLGRAVEQTDGGRKLIAQGLAHANELSPLARKKERSFAQRFVSKKLV